MPPYPHPPEPVLPLPQQLPPSIPFPPLPNPPLAPLPDPPSAEPLPLAYQPFNCNWSVHYMGKIDLVCSHCGALHWMSEKLFHFSQRTPTFGMCCYSAKIKLPKLDDPPPDLFTLLSDQDDVSKKFHDHI